MKGKRLAVIVQTEEGSIHQVLLTNVQLSVLQQMILMMHDGEVQVSEEPLTTITIESYGKEKEKEKKMP